MDKATSETLSVYTEHLYFAKEMGDECRAMRHVWVHSETGFPGKWSLRTPSEGEVGLNGGEDESRNPSQGGVNIGAGPTAHGV